MRIARLSIWLLAGTITLGCAVTPEEEPEPVAVEPVQAEPAPAIDPVLLATLLDQAQAAFDDDHLTTPEEGSADALYREILTHDPANEEAARGRERIVERYIELALRALDRERYATARSMVARARLLNSQHLSIEPTEEQIRLLSQAERIKVSIASDLSDEQLATELQPIAGSPDGFSCRFVIWARNDTQGRRIYRALRAGNGEARLRAQILIRAPVRVERQCFPS